MGWASGMTRIAGALAPTLGGYLLPLSLTLALTVYAVAFLVGGLTVLALGRETRGQPLSRRGARGQRRVNRNPGPEDGERGMEARTRFMGEEVDMAFARKPGPP